MLSSSLFILCARLVAVLCLTAVSLLAQRTVSFVVPNGQIGDATGVRVMLTSQGDENVIRGSLAFSPAFIRCDYATLGADAAGATLGIDGSELSSGRIGFSVTLPAGSAFAAGTREIVVLTFTSVTPTVASASLIVADTPIVPDIVVTTGNTTTTTWLNSFFDVVPPGFPRITIQPGNITVPVGSNATFSVSAPSSPAPSFYWQRQPAGTSGFANLTTSAPYFVFNTTSNSTLSIAGSTLGMSGDQFRVVAANSNGSVMSMPATLTVVQPPAFVSATAATFTPGIANSFTFSASGTPAPTYAVTSGSLPYWATLNATTGVLSGTPPDGAGSPFSFSVTASNGLTATQNFTLSVAPPASRLANLSVRSPVPIEGVTQLFTIEGASRTVLLRAIGPTLASFGISGALADPILTLSNASTGALVATNDNWNGVDASTFLSVGAFGFVG